MPEVAEYPVDMSRIGEVLKERLGVFHLTGEAEGVWGLGRSLFDLTESAARLWEKFIGGNAELRRGSNWNSGEHVNGEHVPAVASVMATWATMREFAIFALLESGQARFIIEGDRLPQADSWLPEHVLYAFTGEGENEHRDLLRKNYNTKAYSLAGTRGSRNEHAFSGRVE